MTEQFDPSVGWLAWLHSTRPPSAEDPKHLQEFQLLPPGRSQRSFDGIGVSPTPWAGRDRCLDENTVSQSVHNETGYAEIVGVVVFGALERRK